ncbi:MAG TPA: serine hydrolase [Bryobacteraceae bacterium]|nr:serine hydrolase [Bryobacteraceae bacterium]
MVRTLLIVLLASAAQAASPIDSMEAAIRSGEFKKITSIVVSRHGKIVYERYFEGDASTLRNTRSATKTVTGMLAGIAIEKGLLAGVNARVAPFFADHEPFENPDPLKSAITVEDFLTMNSALDCNDNVDGSPGNEEKMYPTKDWVRFAFDLPVRKERGFSYCTAGVAMLGEVIQRATKTPVPAFAQKNLFDPLGIERSQWSYSPTGTAMTGGGLELATRDLMKLAQLYANKGEWNDKRIVSGQWVSASVHPRLRIDDHTEYGYLWWITSFQSGGKAYPSYFMTGNGGNKVVVIPQQEMIVVITSTNYNTRGMHQQTERLLTEYILPQFAK